MAPSIPTVEPTEIYAGDTVQWTRVDADYPAADGWTLKYSIKGPTDISDVTATTGTSGEYAVTIAATDTDDAEAGNYRLTGYVTSGSLRHTVYDERLNILPNAPAAADGDELLTQAEQDLAVVDAAIAGRLASDLQDYMVAGTQVTKIPIRDLVRIRTMLRAEVWREQNPGRMGSTIALTYGPVTSSVWDQ